MAFAIALHEWHDFYVLTGTAGATLVALLFVAISLGAGFLTDKRSAATRAFYSPVVVHFGAAFFVSAVALFPAHKAWVFAALIGGCAAIGGTVAVFTTVELLRHGWTKYVQDHLAYGLLPALSYAILLVAAAMIYADNESALELVAAAVLLLVIVNIRNAWDLTLSMVRHQSRRRG
jgi:hypothetical protein